TLTACSGGDPDDGSTEATTPVVTETATDPETSTDEATEEPEDETGDDGTAAPTDAGSPTITGEVPPEEIPTDIPVAGGGAEDLAAFLPQGFPIPEELTITGDPTATAENWRVTFTVPDPAGTFDFFLEALPEAGFELRAGTSDAYNPDVASG